MKSIFKILAVVFVIALSSCTDNTELVENPLNEQQDLYGIDKGDITAPGSDNEEDPDDTEQ